jgi:uncharacterized protein
LAKLPAHSPPTAAGESEDSRRARASSGAQSPRGLASRSRPILFVALANLLLSLWIGTAYLDHLPPSASARIWLFAHLGLVSSLATLTLLPAVLVHLLARLVRSERAFVVVQALVWMLFQVGLYTDTRIWCLFRYHLNGSAWNLLTTRGSQDSYHLGPRIWGVALTLGAILFAGQYLLWRFACARANASPASRTRPLLLRPAILWGGTLLLPICVEKTIYAQADLVLDREVAAVSQIFPIYPRLTVKPLVPREFLEDEPEVRVRHDDARLAYPLLAPRLDGPDAHGTHGAHGIDGAATVRPNILILVLDSWRQDMLAPQVAPELSKFAETSRRFEDHLSGGNGTRFGVFSMLYGLHGSYWWPVLRERRSPVLIDTLLELGYQARVFSSASMDFPEFRSTAWTRISECVEDSYPSARRSERDALLAARFEAWRRERKGTPDAGRPWFAFVILDSPHQTYDFPAESAPFRPYAEDLDYLAMARSQEPALVESVKNRYQNAVHYADHVAGGILDALRSEGELERTLVIVTGDHGEEFAEHGHWGHTSDFTREQAAVPFLLRGPGVAPGRETRPTSHVDVPCTLLELLGADPSGRAAWTLGENLLQPLEQRCRVVAGWEELGLWTSSGIFRVPLDARASLELAAYDARWELLLDQRTAFEREAAALEALTQECARFLDPRAVLLARRHGE